MVINHVKQLNLEVSDVEPPCRIKFWPPENGKIKKFVVNFTLDTLWYLAVVVMKMVLHNDMTNINCFQGTIFSKNIGHMYHVYLFKQNGQLHTWKTIK